jgi:hypothetical protein
MRWADLDTFATAITLIDINGDMPVDRITFKATISYRSMLS